MSAPAGPRAVLDFWFHELVPEAWWKTDPMLDLQIRDRFIALWKQAAAGELAWWRADARGRLAEVIVLDQFSRNLHRDSGQAFAQDPMALVLAQEAVAGGALAALDADERNFLLMPAMHSESAAIHAWGEPLFRAHAPEKNHAFELRHKAIIDRFGRYPHRNAVLGRVSTPEELEFLQQPGSSF
ncbi:DUF924 family protein [Arenimonas sp. MALMAid1274]|uniref:DUF924 family protein n=1 Tax=Arenimonas sp. MALMAid1274 TaxID=3411630 RepID=UPI003B9F4BA0